MARIFGIKNVAFLSTYPPRECGLATFTEDLVNEVSKVGLVRPCIIGVGLEKYEDPRVLYRLNPNEPARRAQKVPESFPADIRLV